MTILSKKKKKTVSRQLMNSNNYETHARENGRKPLNPNGFRESKINFPKRKKPKSKLWLGIILGTLALTGAGITIYLVTRPKTETKNLTTEERVQQFQNQLAQIKTALNTLNQNITATETSLQTKKTEQTQNPQNNSLPAEINQLEQQLTTYKTQKTKIEAIIPKLEQQISDLGKVESSSELNSEQNKVIQELEQEIKQINQELEIPEEPSKKPDTPKSKDPNKPTKNPPSPEKKDNPLPKKDKPNQVPNNSHKHN